jgi:hypothetical protein
MGDNSDTVRKQLKTVTSWMLRASYKRIKWQGLCLMVSPATATRYTRTECDEFKVPGVFEMDVNGRKMNWVYLRMGERLGEPPHELRAGQDTDGSPTGG